VKQLPIVAVVVSVEVSDKVYGTGNTHFVSLRAEGDRSADSEAETMGLDDAMVQSLDMHLRCWESALGAKLASGCISAVEYDRVVRKFMSRISRVKRYLLDDEPLVQKKETAE
jgi:hypothetical protein